MKIQLNYIQGFKEFVKVEQHKLTQQSQQFCSSVILQQGPTVYPRLSVLF